ncbi:MAG: hypothetical protein NWF07_08275, partial [Candidatus Bathyarchaeota archaeon]|nr:hypothetical protein [Candidatus Bathyarchaeota archaeon]
EYVPSNEVSLSEIEAGFPNIHDTLDQPYAELVEAYRHTEYMLGLAYEMDWLVFELNQFSDLKNVEYIQYTKARPIWIEQVLPRYGASNGFTGDLANRQLYDQIKQDFTTILDAHIGKETEKQEEAEETMRRVAEEDLTAYYIPEMYGVPVVESLFPDEELEDPMLSVIYWLYTPETLEEYGLEEYIDAWNAFYEEEEAERHQEEHAALVQQSIMDGVDYLNPASDGRYYSLESSPNPAFWLEQSIADGIDYFNRNPDGSYPPYTGDGTLPDDLEHNYQGDSYTLEPAEFQQRIGQERFNQLDLGEVSNVFYNEGYGYSEYFIDSEKSGKILGIFPVTFYIQTTVDGESYEVLNSNEPWWAFLVF